ncbi:serine/threonine-protein kinase AFC2-like [Hibiscus syriacus]|uniref:serine/threonine-protein kinase AFC2-like n=1 Tax=Hibiscus syriacus TaxID=106335 RepID=UPI001920E50D|nr:serine/threonine-protein kinase AFC2-like [Hibiscus syriacus]
MQSFMLFFLLASLCSRHAEKYVKKGKLDWPAAATSTESIKAVLELPRLQNLVMQHVDHSAGYQIDLLQGLLKFDLVFLNSILAVD